MRVSEKIKLFFKDYYHLFFKDASKNYLRLQQCLPDENGDVTCSVSFSSYTELKKYQKKLRTATVSLASAIAMVIVAFIVAPYVMNPNRSSASSFQWLQNSWGGTANSNPADKVGETDYASKDTDVVAAAGGVSLNLPAAISVTETNDADFSGTKSADGTYVNGEGRLFLRKPTLAACSGTPATECVANNTCTSSLCKKNSGQSCSSATECAGGVCAGGICLQKTVVFVTTTAYNGNLGGRAGADTKCNSEAIVSSLGLTSVKAFLSVNVDDEIQDLPSTGGYSSTAPIYWLNSNGTETLLANNWTAMLGNTIASSQSAGTGDVNYKWSGSTAGGIVSTATCSGWSTAISTSNATVGSATTTSGFFHYTADYCNTTKGLRCIGKR